MTTPTEPMDEAWARLADASESEREAEMLRRYSELAALPEPERQRQMMAMVQAEYALPGEKLDDFTRSRLRTWLKVPEDSAKLIALTYVAVMSHMPSAAALRRVTLVQKLAEEFSEEDEARLRELDPAAFGGRPFKREISRLQTEKDTQMAAAATAKADQHKGWWPFGKK